MIKSVTALGLVLMTCACASDPGPAPGPEGAPRGPQVFVSPFGEPYRAEPGEPYPVAAWFAAADTDGDGKVSRTEFSADGLRFFAALDANQDGVVGQAEIVAYEAMAGRLFEGTGIRGEGGGLGGGGGPRGGHRGGPRLGLAGSGQEDGMGEPPQDGPRRGRRGGGVESSPLAMAGLLNVPEPVKAADVDTNQRITPQEWSQATDRWFGLLDTDRDGVLTLAELPQTGLQRGGGRHGPR